jgi:hypothetical protein
MNEKLLNIGIAILGAIVGIVTTYLTLKDRMVAEIQEEVKMERDLSDLKADLLAAQTDMKEDISAVQAQAKSLQTQVTTIEGRVSLLQMASSPQPTR